MGLHSAITPKPLPPAAVPLNFRFAQHDDDEENVHYEDEDGGECPECGSYSWGNTFYGGYAENMRYTFGQSAYMDSDGMEQQGVDDSEGWECENGHSATQLIADMLSEI
jgi:hypothetical protein